MSSSELREHVKYLTDVPKIAAYRAALQAVMPPDAVVVDLGCGTGLLGLLACQLGARKVYAIDGGPIINVAREVAAAAGFADRIEHIEAMSVDVTLPELADVVVADQIGGLAYEAGVLEYYDDARRFLKPAGVMVPERFELRLAAVESERETLASRSWARNDLGFGEAFAPVARHAVNTSFSVHCTADDMLSSSLPIAIVGSNENTPFNGQASLLIGRDGVLQGLLGMFVATMAPGVTMTNDPACDDHMDHRWQTLLPLADPLDVRVGDVVEASLSVWPASYTASWTVRVVRDSAVLHRERHSTFEGQFLSLQRIAAAATTVPIPAASADDVGFALDLVRAGHSIDSLADALVGSGRFASRAAAVRFAKKLSRLLAR